MDKKNIAIIVLSVAFLITLIGLITTSAKVGRITAEKGEFMQKMRDTEALTDALSRNITDLKAMLGKTEKEKAELAKETKAMKQRLEEAAAAKQEIPAETP